MSIWHVAAAMTCIYYPANRNVAGSRSSDKCVPNWPIFQSHDTVDIFSLSLFILYAFFAQCHFNKGSARFLVFVFAVWFDCGADDVVSMQAVAMRFSELLSSKFRGSTLHSVPCSEIIKLHAP